MEKDELEACKSALADIISVCESHKGLADEYKDEPDGDEGEAPAEMLDAEPVAEMQLDDVGEPHDESDIISVVDRPGGASALNLKRGRGRPRKGSY